MLGSCSYKRFDILLNRFVAYSELSALSTNIDDYFYIQAAGGYMRFLLVLAILAVLPIGSVGSWRPLESGKTFNYRYNGKNWNNKYEIAIP